MITVTVFLSILNQMEFHLVENRKENCHRDHIPFNVKGIGNIVFLVYDVDSSEVINTINYFQEVEISLLRNEELQMCNVSELTK